MLVGVGEGILVRHPSIHAMLLNLRMGPELIGHDRVMFDQIMNRDDGRMSEISPQALVEFRLSLRPRIVAVLNDQVNAGHGLKD